jgi:protein phosphatase
MPPEILKARMMDDKTPEELLDVYAFLCEKNGDDNYTGILAIVE